MMEQGPRQRSGYTTRASIFLRLKSEDTSTRELNWEQFYKRYAPVIAGFARNAGLRGDVIDDVIQDVLLGFFRVAPSFTYDSAKGRFRGYLKKATITTIGSQAAKNRLQLKSDFAELRDEDKIDSMWEAEWRDSILSRALEQVQPHVEPKTFEAFNLYALKEMPAGEVAARLGLSIESVYQAKKRVSEQVGKIVSQIREQEG